MSTARAITIVETYLTELEEELTDVRFAKDTAYKMMANDLYVNASNEERRLVRAIEAVKVILERIENVE